MMLKLTGNSLNSDDARRACARIGMLVDDATVEVENIHRNCALGKPLTVAILDSAQQVALPAIVVDACDLHRLLSSHILSGSAKYLFMPLALAVVASMLASYLLSRTLVTTMSRMLMAGEKNVHGSPEADQEQRQGILGRAGGAFNRLRDRGYARFQSAYGRMLQTVLDHRAFTLIVGVLLLAVTAMLAPAVGTDLFPSADVGLMKLSFPRSGRDAHRRHRKAGVAG